MPATSATLLAIAVRVLRTDAGSAAYAARNAARSKASCPSRPTVMPAVEGEDEDEPTAESAIRRAIDWVIELPSRAPEVLVSAL